MTDGTGHRDRVTGNVTARDITGQVAIGSNVSMTQLSAAQAAALSPADMKELQRAFERLRAHVVLADVSEEHRTTAIEKVQELEEAALSEQPDVSVMERVKNWFADNLPQVAAAVMTVLVNPVVGKLVNVAGDTVANEFRRRITGPA